VGKHFSVTSDVDISPTEGVLEATETTLGDGTFAETVDLSRGELLAFGRRST
jgi:hypothetical protein